MFYEYDINASWFFDSSSQCGDDDDKGMDSETEGVRSRGGREMSRSIRDRICVRVTVVVVVAVVLVVVVVLMVVMGVVVLMVVVGIVVLVMVATVSCIGVVGVVGVLEVYCVGVADILVLDGIFMVKVVEEVELMVECVVRHAVRLVL